ncbi:S8 family peptidase [Sporosarcina aquimarina]|uniref:S8 family serine peptidase n=1 Tax=Sporosarcina aquimarina TaxID=114975 RepID=A0ABU4FW11_9BACL|nr:S8 family serine peptidase [Sporosarcina aquimarina]MDW0108900.1 S8 family serine peptidase [Sporosarcina aquimarina]
MKKRYIQILLLTVLWLSSYSVASASERSEVFLFDESSELHQYKSDLKNEYPDLEVEAIDELGILRVDGQSEQIDMIQPLFANDFVEQGTLPKITSETMVQELETPYPKEFERFAWALKIPEWPEFDYFEAMGNKGVTIAVIDSGIDTEHPLFANNVDEGRSYIENQKPTTDEFGHGTQVAGVLRMTAPKATLVPYKVLESDGNGDSFHTLQAIVHAVDGGADIINVSVGTYKSVNSAEERLTKKAYERAVNYAKRHKVAMVASAGNEGFNLDEKAKLEGSVHLPGGLRDVVTVGSTTKNHELAYYSNYGKGVDIVAPGGDFGPTFLATGEMNVSYMMLTTKPLQQPHNFIDEAVELPPGYTLSFGTSLSAPMVSGAIAILMSNDRAKKPNPNKYIQKIQRTATDLGAPGKDSFYGHGELNILQANK